MIDRIFDLTGKVALVTGGSRGLGKAMALIFAQAGARIAICSRNGDQLQETLEEILRASGSEGRCYVSDLSQREQTRELARQVESELGTIDILVNNAGMNVPQPIDQIDDESWDRSVEVNLNACMALTRAVVPGMKARSWGRIIHISSIMGLASKEGRNSYSATKSALIGLTRSNALDLAPYNITVNCIAPGPFLTELPLQLLDEEQKEVAAGRTALGRWGKPEEIGGLALLLASEAGSYITGSVQVIDGGLLCKTF